MSDASPERANTPSKRSWLSIVLSGTRPCRARLEGVDVVDALSGVRALAEQVLIDVRDRRRVGIDSAVARKDALEQRAFGADRQRGRDTRLQHAVALDDAVLVRIEARPVERVRHLADQARDRVARQPRIQIEGDHIAHVGGQHAVARVEERRLARAAQQVIELVQLAALAFPADPPSLRLVPTAAAMEQEEAVGAGRRRIARVELRDAVAWRRPAGRHPPPSTRSAHRSSRTTARNRSRRPDWKDDEPRAARSARRSRRCVVSRIGIATMRAQILAAPRRAGPVPGSSVAPKPPVIAAVDQHQRRIDRRQQAARRPAAARGQPSTPSPARPSSGSEQDDAGHRRDAADIARDAGPREAAAQRQADRAKADRLLEARRVRRRSGNSPDRARGDRRRRVSGAAAATASARRAISGSVSPEPRAICSMAVR